MFSAEGPDPKWWTRVLSIPPTERILAKPKEGNDVLHVQYALHAPLTGVYDEATEQRVKGIQQAAGLPITGIVDGKTARLIDWLTSSESNG